MSPNDEFNQQLLSNPYFAKGEIIKGFGRGSKELGIPTANFPEDVVDNLPDNMKTGIYCGWARVDNGDIHKMVMSVGWNPYYENEKKSMETHIIHKFGNDFYGSCLRVLMTTYLRPEANYSSLEALIKDINNDIKNANETLDDKAQIALKSHEKLLEDI